MTIFWLLVWLVKGTPPLHQWNAWLVSLLVCGAIDLIEAIEKSNKSA